MLQNELRGKTSQTFDFLFLEKFNDFILYLRNSTTHKGHDISDSERFKAELSVQMSLVFLDYYSTIVFNELKKTEIRKSEDIVIEEIASNRNGSQDILKQLLGGRRLCMCFLQIFRSRLFRPHRIPEVLIRKY